MRRAKREKSRVRLEVEVEVSVRCLRSQEQWKEGGSEELRGSGVEGRGKGKGMRGSVIHGYLASFPRRM